MERAKLMRYDIFTSANDIECAFGDACVILTEGMDRPAHWPDWELYLGTFNTEWRKRQADPEGYVPPPNPEG